MLGLRWLLAAVAATLASGAVRQLADGDFEGFSAEHSTFLLLFYAPWCGHSRKLAPEYERVAADLAGTLAVARADGTEAEELATRLDVKGYPTVFFVRDGETDEYDGERTAGALGAWARAKLAPPSRSVAWRHAQLRYEAQSCGSYSHFISIHSTTRCQFLSSNMF